jgi:hypothetical protein
MDPAIPWVLLLTCLLGHRHCSTIGWRRTWKTFPSQEDKHMPDEAWADSEDKILIRTQDEHEVPPSLK